MGAPALSLASSTSNMAQDKISSFQETEENDLTIRTAPSSPYIQKQKEVIPPATVPPFPSNDITSDVERQEARTGKQKAAEGVQLMALFWTIFCNGCTDGSIGPLLPRIQQVYHVTNILALSREPISPHYLARLHCRIVDLYLLLHCKYVDAAELPLLTFGRSGIHSRLSLEYLPHSALRLWQGLCILTLSLEDRVTEQPTDNNSG